MTTYFVSTTGSNSQAGTIDKPFASLQYAHNLAKPGDTIFIRGGTYSLTTGMQLTKDGTSGQPITVSNYGTEKVIFDGAKMGSGYYKGFMLDMSSVSWNHIKGLEFKNGPDGGVIIRDASHNNVIENLNVHHIGPGTLGEAKGIMLFGASSNNLLLNNDSHDNRDAGYGGADGFQISVTGTGNILRGNRAYGNSDDGIDLYNVHDGTNAAPVWLDGNWSFDNGFNASHQAAGDGTGFKLGGNRSGTGGTSGGHTLTNNIAWDNRVYGFYENGANKTSYLYNNSAYDNGSYNYLFSSGASDTLTNNLAYGTGKVLASGSVKNNTWNMSVSMDGSDFMSLNDSIARGVRAADGSLPYSGFLRLAAGSDLIDKGANIPGLTYLGAAPDAGGFEYGIGPIQGLSSALAQGAAPSPTHITGTGASNRLAGTASSDAIYGFAGGDTLIGKSGNDLLSGGWGTDKLAGGLNRDAFLFDTKLSVISNVDSITDFSVKDDTIKLDDAVFAKIGPGSSTQPVKLEGKMFHKGGFAHDADDRIIYDHKSGNLYYDPDGTGSAPQIQFAHLDNQLKMTSYDFFIV